MKCGQNSETVEHGRQAAVERVGTICKWRNVWLWWLKLVWTCTGTFKDGWIVTGNAFAAFVVLFAVLTRYAHSCQPSRDVDCNRSVAWSFAIQRLLDQPLLSRFKRVQHSFDRLRRSQIRCMVRSSCSTNNQRRFTFRKWFGPPKSITNCFLMSFSLFPIDRESTCNNEADGRTGKRIETVISETKLAWKLANVVRPVQKRRLGQGRSKDNSQIRFHLFVLIWKGKTKRFERPSSNNRFGASSLSVKLARIPRYGNLNATVLVYRLLLDNRLDAEPRTEKQYKRKTSKKISNDNEVKSEPKKKSSWNYSPSRAKSAFGAQFLFRHLITLPIHFRITSG